MSHLQCHSQNTAFITQKKLSGYMSIVFELPDFTSYQELTIFEHDRDAGDKLQDVEYKF